MALALLSYAVPAVGQDLQPLRERYRNMLVEEWSPTDSLFRSLLSMPKETVVSDQMVQELTNMYPPDTKQVEEYLGKLRSDGSFSDINYQDKTRSGWQPKQHAERTLQLCKLYATPSSAYYRSARIDSAIHRLIRFWFVQKPKSLNWWQNEIGIPKVMGEAFIIIYGELSPWERQQAVGLMSAARIGKTGQNKVWLAQNVLMRGLIDDDAATVGAARDSIFSEITTGGKEGIQSDWSYLLHGPQQQFGNYGLAFLGSMTFFYKLFEGTPWAMPAEKKQVLVNLVDKGYRWVIWHRQMDINALGRQLFHNVSAQKGLLVAMLAERLGLGGFPAETNNLVGHKHFSSSDYTIHRTPSWMVSLKMCSQRTIGTEHVNEDNRLGYYLGDGATYYYTANGTADYMVALPVWDWRKTPGTTTLDSPKPHTSRMNTSIERNHTTMVGGIAEGLYGLSAMDYNRDGVKAHKAWFFTPKFVVCLGSGITSDTTLSVSTTIDQRASRTPLLALSDGQWQSVSHANLSNPRLYHGDIGYIVLDGKAVECERGLRKGSWSANMGLYAPAEVADTIMCLTINHGVQPLNTHYAYIVMPGATPQEVAQMDISNIKVVMNDNQMQLVAFGDDCWAAVYEGRTLPYGIGDGAWVVPGLYHITPDGIITIKHFF